ncbi:MAG: hypothetical protein H0U39_06510 [Segetibacter sp.]|nr:hypothetical protein [Segetibacter sp.]
MNKDFCGGNDLLLDGLSIIDLKDIQLQHHMPYLISEKRSGAKEVKKENSNGDELFVRLSAYEDDLRIDKKNECLLPGSFTTTASDALKCKKDKEDSIKRYALPNELPIRWAFYIQPNSLDILQRGSVQRAFGKEGGGREVYFEKGTSIRTFITQTQW